MASAIVSTEANGVGASTCTGEQARLAKPRRFKGRTVAVVNDFTSEDQWFLYQKTRELKDAVRNSGDLERFRLRNPEIAVYTIFMEDSTRTKESFRNAAEFHGLKVNVFDTKTSAFQKNETITDTMKMLCGYSTGQSLFVIRSKLEGVCRWLEDSIGSFTTQRRFPRASFVNAGDGRHEHPTQEFLDEFSFLEHKDWDASSIHLALLGDLHHGRTVHSKVDGLKIYGAVDVDLIAPPELELPPMYEERMVKAGYHVRKFASIAEYLEQPNVAKIWYFTRLQMERMDQKMQSRSPELRKAVTFQREFLDRLPEGTKFFHPLPRDARHPTLPFWLDHMEYNGWDQQSQNGYFTRIVLLGMLGGLFDEGLGPSEEGAVVKPPPDNSPESPLCVEKLTKISVDLLKEIPFSLDDCEKRMFEVGGLAPFETGVMIDRLGAGRSGDQLWSLLFMVRSILGLNTIGTMGVYAQEKGSGEHVGFLTIPDLDIERWDRLPLKRLAAAAPGAELIVVQDNQAQRRFQLLMPPRIYNFSDTSCKNIACISHPSNQEPEVTASFLRVGGETQNSSSPLSSSAFSCKYCDWVHSFSQIWDFKY